MRCARHRRGKSGTTGPYRVDTHYPLPDRLYDTNRDKLCTVLSLTRWQNSSSSAQWYAADRQVLCRTSQQQQRTWWHFQSRLTGTR